jgi:hypothetical protein
MKVVVRSLSFLGSVIRAYSVRPDTGRPEMPESLPELESRRAELRQDVTVGHTGNAFSGTFTIDL